MKKASKKNKINSKLTSLKTSLVVSFVSLLVCVSMLSGTTYAWMNIKISSGANIIKANNLDVALNVYESDDNYVKLTDDNFLADDNGWEPGEIKKVYLEVDNCGTSPLIYTLNVIADQREGKSEKAGKNVLNNSFLLSNYLLFSFKKISHNETLTDSQAKSYSKDNGKKLCELSSVSNDDETALNSNEKHYYALIIQMPEDVGDNINYKGTKPVMPIRITLTAEQS